MPIDDFVKELEDLFTKKNMESLILTSVEYNCKKAKTNSSSKNIQYLHMLGNYLRKTCSVNKISNRVKSEITNILEKDLKSLPSNLFLSAGKVIGYSGIGLAFPIMVMLDPWAAFLCYIMGINVLAFTDKKIKEKYAIIGYYLKIKDTSKKEMKNYLESAAPKIEEIIKKEMPSIL